MDKHENGSVLVDWIIKDKILKQTGEYKCSNVYMKDGKYNKKMATFFLRKDAENYVKNHQGIVKLPTTEKIRNIRECDYCMYALDSRFESLYLNDKDVAKYCRIYNKCPCIEIIEKYGSLKNYYESENIRFQF